MTADWDPWDNVAVPGTVASPPDDGFEAAVPELLEHTLSSLDLDSLPTPVAVVDGVLYRDSLAWLQGRPGSGKSFVALDIAGCVAAGHAWQGHRTGTDVNAADSVLYVVAEGTSGLRQRVRAWESAMGAGAQMCARFLPRAVQVANSAEWSELVELAAWGEYGLIVLDTQARLTVGMEENAARDMGMWVHRLEQLRAAAGACVLVVHHQGRTGEHMRGSTAMEGAANTVIQVGKDDDLLTVRCLKQKDAPEFDDIVLRLIPHADSAVLGLSDGRRLGSATAIAVRWLTSWYEMHGDEPVSISVLVKSGVVSETTFHRSKLPLIDEGAVERKGEGNGVRYRLRWTPAGLPTPIPKGMGVGGSQSNSHGTPTGAWES